MGRTPEIIKMFGGSTSNIQALSEAEARNWVDRLAEHPRAWAIEHDKHLLGEIRLDGVDDRDMRASLAIGLYDPGKLGRGLGREAIRLLLGHAFNALNLHRIGVRVIAYNVRAIRCYSACGFREEGREREAAFVDGTWYDDVIMGLIAHEFASS